jgi:hypothetical protein
VIMTSLSSEEDIVVEEENVRSVVWKDILIREDVEDSFGVV